MCGIVGYAGQQQAAPILLDGLSKLEYRGYDSAGVCVHGEEGLQVAKAKGRLQVLCDQTENGENRTEGRIALVQPDRQSGSVLNFAAEFGGVTLVKEIADDEGGGSNQNYGKNVHRGFLPG